MTVRFSTDAKLVIFVLILFFGAASFLFAQDEELYTRRIVWRGDENVFRYSVEIQKSESGRFRSLLQEYTTSSFLVVSLPAGEYRFRITPHDILDRPHEATQWVRFTIRAAPAADNKQDTSGESERIEVIDFEKTRDSERSAENNEQLPESNDIMNAARYNSIAISIGTAFADPLVTAAIHGTYAPVNNFFIGAGFDAGFLSMFDGVDNFYSLYPYINAGFFMPVGNQFGVYAGAGAGYLIGGYEFSHGGKSDIGVFAVNITTGVNIFDAVNISYTFKTNFNAASHRIAVGFIYRFRQGR